MAKPKKQITYLIFRHDKFVLESRLDLELNQKVSGWISDSALSSGVSMNFGLDWSFAPDGIYTLPSGERIAFELEIAPKSKKDHRKKIEAFVRAIRARAADPAMFKRVHYRCLTGHAYRLLKAETEIYGELFFVEYKDMGLAAEVQK